MLDTLLVCSAAFAILAIATYRSLVSRLPLPPGPKARFISGNVHQLPASHPWLRYTEWSKQHGPSVYFRVFTRRVLVLNSLKAATDLLESRSTIYSDRPILWMYTELINRKLAVFNISSKNPRFKRYRRILHSSLNPRAAQSFRALQVKETHTLLRGLAASPQDFMYHIRRNAGAVMLKYTYGWTVKSNDDPLLKILEDSIELQTVVTKPGRWLVDTFPILRFVPAWLPFANFKRMAAEYRREFSRVDDIPHEWAKQQIDMGIHVDSFASRHLRTASGMTVDAEEEDIIKWCSVALFAGGSDTVVGVVKAFILAMSLYPQYQKRAQLEIAEVIGSQKLPTFDDQPRLPYVMAIFKEVLRWAPVAPLGLPHSVTQDDIYEDYLIPKGTTVIANIWGISHDPDNYPEPSVFNPERFLPHDGGDSGLDPRKFVFGFGRRVCPGSHFAEVSVFLVISNILAMFNIDKAVDEKGEVIDPSVEFTSAVTSHVKPFDCRITVCNPELLAALEAD
ncbi:cytochrome P450 [Laetiporus sulphureus 93-53]|uniref:Cytochrome P450 n=1 Tax=Laetiporus sulphureus 93-53 TaxID=1314785 RepID=A0A165BWH5_9APHY|nr:cytochrome P450 [Laetiporus sulphureus 93-53]KZT01777.1 cytochrome P450 [Laetiporus sulphureus 93-53]